MSLLRASITFAFPGMIAALLSGSALAQSGEVNLYTYRETKTDPAAA